MKKIDLEERIRKLEKEEQELQFEHFSNDDAWNLGQMLVEAAKEKKVYTALEIIVNGCVIFKYSFPHTNRHNAMWLRRKSNTVNTTHMSSLHAGTLLQQSGEDIGKDWFLQPEDYACLGGGFPITIRGTGVIGSVCCSGLPHEQDHRMVVDTIRKYIRQ